jgi:flagellar protein FliO/FliZ
MARLVDPARPSFASLAAGTPAARIGTALDAFRRRHPVRFWAGAAGLGLLIVAGLALRPTGATPAAANALDAFGSSTSAGSATSSLVVGAIDPVDLVVKGGLVVVLLFATLKVMRRLGGEAAPADARIRILETRTLAAKAQLHLVEVGGRQVLIGATPGRLVTLAELTADPEREAEAVEPARTIPMLEPSATILQPLDDSFAAALLHETGLAAR